MSATAFRGNRPSDEEPESPYLPNQPAESAALFCGRQDLLSSIRDNLVKGRQVFVISGERRIGKTSFLLQLPASLPDGFCTVLLQLMDEPGQRLDWVLWRLAEAMSRDLGRQLGTHFPGPDWDEYEDQPELLLQDLWPRVRALLGDRPLVLLLDDLDRLSRGDSKLLSSLLAFLKQWLAAEPGVAVIATVTTGFQDLLAQDAPHLFDKALVYTLGPLASDDAVKLITKPVEGVLIYDYGVPRRIVELTSGQPYYLQLLCSELFDQCLRAGWVNQRDVDRAVSGLVKRDIPEFRQLWQESSSQEQAALAALASLRGARGVGTASETRAVLTRVGVRVTADQMESVMEHLVSRGVLERLGALSYRFRVSLLRDWLSEHFGLPGVIVGARRAFAVKTRPHDEAAGSGVGAMEKPKPVPAAPPPAPGETPRERMTPARRLLVAWRRPALVAAVLVLVGGTAYLLAHSISAGRDTATPPAGMATTSSPAALQTLTATATPVAIVGLQTPAAPSPSPPPEATLTAPSPTALPFPSVAYLGKGAKDKEWSIYLSGGGLGRQTRLIAAPAGFLAAPSWSPDGTQLAFVSERDGSSDIWVVNADGSNARNLTRNNAKETTPAWSPDGQWIAFASLRDSRYYQLYVMRPDGSEVRRLTWWKDASDLSPAWSADSKRLAFASKRDGNWEIYITNLDGSGLVRLTDNPSDDNNPAWSPDGSRIAFTSTRDGYADIYVMLPDGSAVIDLTKAPWSTDLGPSWSPDGRRIVFFSDRDRSWDIYVMNSDGSHVVRVTQGDTNNQLPAWRP